MLEIVETLVVLVFPRSETLVVVFFFVFFRRVPLVFFSDTWNVARVVLTRPTVSTRVVRLSAALLFVVAVVAALLNDAGVLVL